MSGHRTILHVIPEDLARGAQVHARELRVRLDAPAEHHRLAVLFGTERSVTSADIVLGARSGIGRNFGFSPTAYVRLWRLARTMRPDVVVAHGGEPLKYVALLPRSVRVYHRIGGRTDGKGGRSQVAYRWLARRFAATVAVSTALAGVVRRDFGIPEDRVRVIFNGRDSSVFRPGSTDREPAAAVRILHVGHLYEGKRPELFAQVVGAMEGVEATVVGDGPLLELLRARYPRVAFLGRREDVAALLAEHDMFVFTSALDEGLPGVLVEAALAGLPIVTTDVPGAADVVENEATGLIVPVDDRAALEEAVARLAGDADLRQRMGSAARARAVQLFDIDAGVAAWRELVGTVGTLRSSRRMNPATRARRVLHQVLDHPANRGSRTRAIGRSLAWQVRKRLAGGPVRVRAYGFDLEFPPRSGSASNLAYFGEAFEWQNVNFLRAYLQPGDRVLDVGANVGMFTYAAAQQTAPDGVIECFEPLPWAAAAIRRNLERTGLSRRVTLHEVAASDSASTATFTADLDVSSHLAYVRGATSSRSSVTVRTARLDDVVSSGPIALAKVDVEGAESLALEGFLEHLSVGNPPVVLVEAFDHLLARMGSSRSAVIDRLRSFGYEPHEYEPATGELRLVTEGVPDLIFVYRPQFGAVTARLGRRAAPTSRKPMRLRAVAWSALGSGPVSALARAVYPDAIAVLAYHAVPDADLFASHLDYLARACDVLPLDGLLDARKGATRRRVVITFDDGDRTLFDVAMPLLVERGLPAVAFVLTGVLDSDMPFWWDEVAALSARGGKADVLGGRVGLAAIRWLKTVPDTERRSAIEQLRASAGVVPVRHPQLATSELAVLEANGITIGNHTHTHPLLDQCESAVVEGEVREAHRRLTAALGHAPRAFAFPNGNYDERAVKVLDGLGYEALFGFDHRLTAVPLPDRTAISRVRVDADAPIHELRAIVGGAHPALHRLRQRLA